MKRKPALLVDPVEDAGGPHWLARTNNDNRRTPTEVDLAPSCPSGDRGHRADLIESSVPVIELEDNGELQYAFHFLNTNSGDI